ncbi:MAG: DUF1553 domain-containing protein, partial [Planctomycetia bacterium]
LDPTMRRRSIYFFIKRSQLAPTMMLFDWPEHLGSIGRRGTTTVAPQALLFLINAETRADAVGLAERFKAADAAGLVDGAYRTALSRPPVERETTAGVRFIQRQTEAYTAAGRPAAEAVAAARVDYCQAVFGLNEFIYVD